MGEVVAVDPAVQDADAKLEQGFNVFEEDLRDLQRSLAECRVVCESLVESAGKLAALGEELDNPSRLPPEIVAFLDRMPDEIVRRARTSLPLLEALYPGRS